MPSFIDVVFKKKKSGAIAKDRLRVLLISDRANCSPEMIDRIKDDIIKIISKYMEIDTEGLDIQVTQSDTEGDNSSGPAISAHIPIQNMHHKAGKGEK